MNSTIEELKKKLNDLDNMFSESLKEFRNEIDKFSSKSKNSEHESMYNRILDILSIDLVDTDLNVIKRLFSEEIQRNLSNFYKHTYYGWIIRALADVLNNDKEKGFGSYYELFWDSEREVIDTISILESQCFGTIKFKYNVIDEAIEILSNMFGINILKFYYKDYDEN